MTIALFRRCFFSVGATLARGSEPDPTDVPHFSRRATCDVRMRNGVAVSADLRSRFCLFVGWFFAVSLCWSAPVLRRFVPS